MLDFATWFLILIAIVLGGVVLPLVFLWFMSIVGNKAPFVPVPRSAVPGIVKALELTPGSVVYDMGCGDGRILRAAAYLEPGIRVVGIENAFLPYALAWLNLKSISGAKIIRQDFFTVPVGEATHVVLYLFPSVMDNLTTKLQSELKPGTKVLAVDFSFNGLIPKKVIKQPINGLRRGSELRLYEF